MSDRGGKNTSSILPEQLLSAVTVRETKWELWWSGGTAEYVLRVTMGHPPVSQVVARVHGESPIQYLDLAIQTASRSMLNLTHFCSVTAKTSLDQHFM